MSSRVPSGSTVPFTPKPNKKHRSSRLTLSDQEFNNIAGTLASVRKVKTDTILEEWDSPEGIANGHAIRRLDGPSKPSVSSARPASSSSTHGHARPSSATASANSRVPSAASSSRHDERERAIPSRHEDRDRAALSRNGKRPERIEPPVQQVQALRIQDEVEASAPLAAEPSTSAARRLDGVPLEIQEAWICEDLMFLLQGVEGSLIRYEESYDPLDEDQRLQGARWRVDPSLDPSLLSLVERLLPLATYYTAVEASMESRNTSEYGMVSHALCSGIRSMLKEYRVLTAQLESLYLSSSTFTLQTLYYHLHPTIHTMSLLASLCQALETDEASRDVSADNSDDEDEDDFGGKAAELGLGGAALKGLMGGMKGQQGLGSGADIPAGEVIGGEVLGIVHERETTMSGDPTASTLHTTLLQHASQPYCRMLIKWITTGYLSDPFDEFMVKESTHISKTVLESDYTDEYWERRYTLRDGSSLASSSAPSGNKSAPSMNAGVPSVRQGTNRLPGGACMPAFLQPWKHKILLAGKYLNVIRECGIEVKKPGEVEVEDGKDSLVIMNEPKFYKRIEDAYIYANKTLLRLMLEEQELIPHLRSMKHFFFLDQSDFLTNFLDLAHSELRKQSKQASLVKLQSLLDLAVRNPASSSSNDPYKDNLKVTIASQGLYDWLLKIVSRTGGGLGDDGNGGGGGGGGDLDFGSSDKLDDEAAVQKTLFAHDAVAFDFSVKFPLSLVISRKTITRYQLIFRFLLHLHHLESGLSAMWLDHKAPSWRDDCGHADMQRWKSRIFSLRTRMLVFVRQILAFVTGEVLETNWRNLEAKIAKVQTVDQLLRDHVDFLDTCLKQCMLTTSKLLIVYSKLMKTIATFVSYQPKLSVALDHFLANPNGESESQRAKRWEILNSFEANYNHNTQLHLDAVTYNAGSENVALLALVTRLHQTTMRF